MTLETGLVLIILAVAIALLVTERLRVDFVAILVLLALALTGLVPPADAVAGFGSPAVATMAGVFVLSAGLQRTGVANAMGRWVKRVGGGSELCLVVVLMLTAGSLSFFMNTVAIVALLLPVVMDLARDSGVAPSRVLMPLAFGSLLGGLTTTFATLPNLLASEALRDAGLRPFGVFDFLIVGGVAAAAGIAFMAVVGRRMLPARDLEREAGRPHGADLHEHYALQERMFVLRAPPGSALSGRTLEESRLGSALRLHVVGIVRRERTLLAPGPDATLMEGDRLLVQGTPEQLGDLAGWQSLEASEGDLPGEGWFPEGVQFAEARLAASSPLVGRTLAWLDARRAWGVTVIAHRREGRARRSRVQEVVLRAGDTLLAQGTAAGIETFRQADRWESFDVVPWEQAAAAYEIEARLFTVTVPAGSPLEGRTLAQSRLGEALGLTALALERGEERIMLPGPDEKLQGGDRLLVEGRSDDLSALRALGDFELEREVAPELSEIESEKLGLMEAVLSPRTSLAGKTLRQLRFRERYGLSVMGIWREGRRVSGPLGDEPLRFGDALLLYGPRESLKQLAREADFIVLTEAVQDAPRAERAGAALGALAVFLALASSGLMPTHVAALTGAALMVLLGCLRLDEAYEAVEWKAIVLIAGMLPLADAAQGTGAAAGAAAWLSGSLEGLSPRMIIAVLFLATAAGALVMPSAAVVVLVAPIALETAASAGISPHAVMMAVAMAAAAGFNSPVSHAANVLVMGPGGYRFMDFPRVGAPLTLVVLAAVLVVLPIFWPLR